nr:MAG TPA: Rad52/22 family double-strand break repair protein [Caudoviricetes sp.]
MMEKMELYDSFRAVPENAKRSINAGRLKGKTDINPMWRIKALTERFGPCGIGWKYEIVNQALQNGANGEIAAFVDIRLCYKVDDVWSEPVYGVGGSMFVAKERNGLYTSDECFKMALTDAISVAAKALGIGADVYWQADATKYTPPQTALPKCEMCGGDITADILGDGKLYSPDQIARATKKQTGQQICSDCMRKLKGHETAS